MKCCKICCFNSEFPFVLRENLNLNDVDAVMHKSLHMVYSHLHALMKSVRNNVQHGPFEKCKMLISLMIIMLMKL